MYRQNSSLYDRVPVRTAEYTAVSPMYVVTIDNIIKAFSQNACNLAKGYNISETVLLIIHVQQDYVLY